MKNYIFNKAAALAMGSLLIFSGQALAMKANHSESTNAEVLNESEIVIAQRRGRNRDDKKNKKPLKEDQAFAQSTSLAITQLGKALAAANAQAIGGSQKTALAQSISQAFSLIGNATALSNSTAESDQAAAAQSLSQAETVIGDALAIAESEAISGDGKPAVAQSLATAKTAIGSATAIASSTAR